MTPNQASVLATLRYSTVPLTVREIADSRAMTVSTARHTLAALERHGAVERCGVSLSGGTTWTLFGRAAASA